MWFETDDEDVGFPKSRCATCEREVVVYRTLDDAGQIACRCLDCNGPMPDPEGAWSRDELIEAGYKIEGQGSNAQKGSCGNCGV